MKSNINKLERILSIAAGGALAVYGFTPKTDYKRFTLPSILTTVAGAGLTTYGLLFQKKRTVSTRNIILGAIGAGLVVRGVSGFSLLYKGLGVSSNRNNVVGDSTHRASERKGKKVTHSVIINAPVDRVYKTFSNFESFPQWMNNIVSVKYTGADITHWVVKSITGVNFEYDARIKTNIPNEVISWESISGELPNAGAVRFHDLNGSTRLEVTMEINPPGGVIGEKVADVLHDPEKQLQEDLNNFKRLVETNKVNVNVKGA